MRDPIPGSIELYHISEDANDFGYNDAPELGIFGNVRATLEALADELEPRVPPAIVKQYLEEAQRRKDILWRGLMEQADAAIRADEKIEPIVAARDVLRPLPDGLLLVDEALCSNLFTQPMHRSTGGRQYFHKEVPVVLNNREYGILESFMLSQPQYNARAHGFLVMDICSPKVGFQSLARAMGVEPTFVNSPPEN
jgi:thiamine pyrophosphate-dependent acetolactate synthase large subunit-like protein